MAIDHDRVESIFNAAIAMGSVAERAGYLDIACAHDIGLRERVEALLAAHDGAESFLARPPAPAAISTAGFPTAPLAEGPGARIGRYKLLQLIGEGGFGTVFMAEQEHPVRRKVALKIIKLGMDTRQVIARFEAERQALALMEHESIAKVLDAGATDSGRPYFVMELVHGVPITEYCDKNQLPPRQRLELFVQVCRAVQHAHGKGIIHRDIKPTNVLVTLHEGVAVPKVIDFGIAKATGQQLTEKTLFTNFAQMVGTPLYMSPEQAEMTGIDVDTRSDVYSLGVLIYELLTGTTPFDRERFKQAAYDEIRRIIREEDPPKPSTRLSASQATLPSISAQRHTKPAKLTRLVRGELDWIVMKALEKDRNRRYETANGLAMDVQRYLADEPVLACPPSAAYRLRKFARRHKGPVVAAALVLLTLVGGVIGTTLGLVRAADRAKGERQARQEAQQREAETRAVLDFVERKVFDAARSQGDQRSLGQNATLLKLLEETLAVRKATLGPDHRDTLACIHNLALSYRDRGHLHCQAGRLREAVADFERAMELDPDDTWDWYGAAALYLYVGDLPRYRAACRQMLDRAEKPAVEYARVAERTAKTCALAPDAVADFSRVERLAQRAVTGTEHDEWHRNFILAKAMTDYRGGRHAQAVEGLMRFAPRSGNIPWDATAFATLAMAEHRLGHAEQARAALTSAHGIVAAKPQNWMTDGFWFDWLHCEVLCREADGLLGTLSPPELTAARRRQWEREVADLTRNVQRHPGSPNALGARAVWLLVHGRFEEADRDYERLLQLHPVDYWHWYRRGCVLAYLGREEQHREHCRAMLERFAESRDAIVLHRTTRAGLLLPPSPAGGGVKNVQEGLEELARRAERADQLRPDTTWGVVLKGMAEYRAGRHQTAVELMDKYHRIERDNWPAGAVAADAFLAMAHLRLGRQQEARAALERAARRAAADLPAADSGYIEIPHGIEDWMVAQIALREAEEALLGRRRPAAPAATGPAVPPPPASPSAPSPFRGQPATLPGVVHAEDFDEGGQGLAYHDTTYTDNGGQKATPRYRLESVDVDDSSDPGGGFNVGGILPGEWLAYTVEVNEEGTYDLFFRFSSPHGGKLHVEFGGKDVTGPVDLPATGNWNTWNTVNVKGVRLSAGRQVMRVAFDTAAAVYVGNLNWIVARRSP